MSYPDKKQSLFLLQKWLAMHAGLARMMSNAEAVFGSMVESPFFETTWKNFDTYTEALALLLGDKLDWLAWYYSENQMGARSHAAGYDGRLRKIKNLNGLYWLISEGRKREGQP